MTSMNVMLFLISLHIRNEEYPPFAITWMELEGIFFKFILFIYDRHTVREREAETPPEGEAGSMHREPDMGFDPESPGSRPGQRQAPNRCATQGSQKS